MYLLAEDRFLTVVCAYAPNNSLETPAYLKLLEAVPPAPSPNGRVQCNSSEPWRGVIGMYGLPDQNPSDVLLLNFWLQLTFLMQFWSSKSVLSFA